MNAIVLECQGAFFRHGHAPLALGSPLLQWLRAELGERWTFVYVFRDLASLLPVPGRRP